MKNRIVGILLLLLMGLCIFALGRRVASEGIAREKQLLAFTAREHALLCAEYFAARADVVKSLRMAVDGKSDSQAQRTFVSLAPLADKNFRGVARLMLFNSQGRIMAEWPEEDPAYAVPAELLASFAQEAQNAGGARASGAFQLSGKEGYALLVADSFTDGSKRLVAGVIECTNAVAPPVRGLPAGSPVVYLMDASGTVLASGAALTASDVEQEAAFPVVQGAWTVRARADASWKSGLIFSRMIGFSIALLMIAILGALWVMHANQHAALLQANARLEAELATARRFNARLVRLNRELDEFTHVVSHELKEPLRGVDGLARMLMEECGYESQGQGLEYLASIRNSTARMRRLVDDLLRLSRVGRRHYPRESVDFNDLLRDVVTSLEFAISAKSAVVTVQPGLPAIVCDRVRMAELFQNLLSNALKFSGERPPRVEIGHRLDNETHLFWVKDNGIGISPQDVPRIFEIFHRVDQRTEGSGIGLTICKRIVEGLGGRIWVESQPQQGSTFFFTLPRGAEERTAGDAADELMTA